MIDILNLAVKGGTVAENFKQYGGTVTLSGFIIVFAMLILFVFVISAFGAIMSRTAGKPKKANRPPSAVASSITSTTFAVSIHEKRRLPISIPSFPYSPAIVYARFALASSPCGVSLRDCNPARRGI